MGVATGHEKEPTSAKPQQISIQWWIVDIMSSTTVERRSLGRLLYRAGSHFTIEATEGMKICRFSVFYPTAAGPAVLSGVPF